MLIMIVLLAYRIIMINQTGRTQVVKDVVRLHIVAASTILFYAMTILNINETFALVSYGLCFWCSDFVLLLFFIYINDFTQETFVNKKGGIIIGVLIAIDGVLCFINIFKKFLFSVALSGDEDNGYYYKVAQRTGMYMYHKVFVYAFAVMTLLLLFYEIYKAARIYVKQYYAILYCFLFTIATNVVYEILDLEFDYSVLFYGIIAEAIYYFTFRYVPKGLVEKTLVMVVQNFSDGVVCMDINGRCVYVNVYARQVFHVDKDIREIENYYRSWKGDRKPEEIEECSWQGETEINGKQNFFAARYRGIWDEDNRCMMKQNIGKNWRKNATGVIMIR